MGRLNEKSHRKTFCIKFQKLWFVWCKNLQKKTSKFLPSKYLYDSAQLASNSKISEEWLDFMRKCGCLIECTHEKKEVGQQQLLMKFLITQKTSLMLS